MHWHGDRVARCARFIGHDLSLFTNYRVNQSRFAYVWASNHRNRNTLVDSYIAIFATQFVERVLQLRDAPPMRR